MTASWRLRPLHNLSNFIERNSFTDFQTAATNRSSYAAFRERTRMGSRVHGTYYFTDRQCLGLHVRFQRASEQLAVLQHALRTSTDPNGGLDGRCSRCTLVIWGTSLYSHV